MRAAKVAGAVLMLAAVGTAWAAPAGLPTMDDIKASMDKSDWKTALQQIARVSELKGDAAAAYDRPTLLMDKAECQLQNHDNSGAIATLATAAKEAKDANAAAEPLALTELIKKSPAGVYTPKGPGKTPIKVVDRDQRKDAYAALEADELTLLQTQVKNVSTATSLPPIVNVAKTAGPVRALAIAAIGKSTEVDDVTKQLSAQAQKLMTEALNGLSKQVEQISTNANRQITVTQGMNLGGRYGGAVPVQQSQAVGLSGNDANTLRGIEKQCDQFPPAAKELGTDFGDDTAFAAIGTQANQIKTRADTVLNASYGTNGLGAPVTPTQLVPHR